MISDEIRARISPSDGSCPFFIAVAMPLARPGAAQCTTPKPAQSDRWPDVARSRGRPATSSLAGRGELGAFGLPDVVAGQQPPAMRDDARKRSRGAAGRRREEQPRGVAAAHDL